MEVICINDIFNEIQKKLIPNRPVKDKIYTIRDFFTLPNGQKAVYLEEIINPHIEHPSGLGTFEPNFDARRFRTLYDTPIHETSFNISHIYS